MNKLIVLRIKDIYVCVLIVFRFLGEDVYVYLYGDDIDELVININMLRLSLLDEDDL